MFKAVFLSITVVMVSTVFLFFINLKPDNRSMFSGEEYMKKSLSQTRGYFYGTPYGNIENCENIECRLACIVKSLKLIKKGEFSSKEASSVSTGKVASDEELAVYTAAVLDSSGIKSTIFGLREGIYVAACGIDSARLYDEVNYSDDSLIYKDKIKLAGGQLWFKSTDYSGDALITLKSSSPVSFSVQNKVQFDANSNKCSGSVINMLNLKCALSKQESLYIKALKSDVMIDIKVYAEEYKANYPFIYRDGLKCAVIDMQTRSWAHSFDGRVIYTIN